MSRESSPGSVIGTPARDADVHSRGGTAAAKRNARSNKRDIATIRARDLQPMERKARSMLHVRISSSSRKCQIASRCVKKRVRDKYRELTGVKKGEWWSDMHRNPVNGQRIPDFEADVMNSVNKGFINDVAHQVCEEIKVRLHHKLRIWAYAYLVLRTKGDIVEMLFLTKHQIHWDENTIVKITKEVHRGFKVEYEAQEDWETRKKQKKSQKENRLRQRRKTVCRIFASHPNLSNTLE